MNLNNQPFIVAVAEEEMCLVSEGGKKQKTKPTKPYTSISTVFIYNQCTVFLLVLQIVSFGCLNIF